MENRKNFGYFYFSHNQDKELIKEILLLQKRLKLYY